MGRDWYAPVRVLSITGPTATPHFTRRLAEAGQILDVRILDKEFRETAAFLACDTIVIRIQAKAVYFTESFSQDLRRLSQQLHLPLHEKHERRFVKEFSVSPNEMKRALEMLDSELILLEKVTHRLDTSNAR